MTTNKHQLVHSSVFNVVDFQTRLLQHKILRAKITTYNILNSLRSACTSLQLLYRRHIMVIQSRYSWHALDPESSTS